MLGNCLKAQPRCTKDVKSVLAISLGIVVAVHKGNTFLSPPGGGSCLSSLYQKLFSRPISREGRYFPAHCGVFISMVTCLVA